MAGYLASVVEELFELDSEGPVGRRPHRNKALISGLGMVSDAAEVAATYQEAGPVGRDLRRVGVSWD